MICSFNAAQVLFLYTPSNLGGLGLEPRQISFVLVIRPIIMALFNTSIYPTFSRRFGPEALLRISVCFWPLTYGIYLGMAFVASKGVSVALLPPLLFVAAATDVVACMSFIAQDSLVGKRVPHKRHLAHMNAVGGLAANMVSFFHTLSIPIKSAKEGVFAGRRVRRSCWKFVLRTIITEQFIRRKSNPGRPYRLLAPARRSGSADDRQDGLARRRDKARCVFGLDSFPSSKHSSL